MLRKITRSGQVSIPKKVLNEFHLVEGDYVDIEANEAAILIKPVTVDEFSSRDYEKFAAKLAKLEKQKGTHLPDSDSARKHLKKMMK